MIVLISSGSLCFGGDPGRKSEKRIWGRSLIGEAEDGKDKRLDCGSINQGPDHLVATCILSREVEGTVPQLLIQGHFNKMGEFTPNVSLEVSDQEDTNWKTIESSFSHEVEVTLTGAPHTGILFTRIQLDALQPYIGKFKFCRIALQTGESTAFPLVWLAEKGE